MHHGWKLYMAAIHFVDKSGQYRCVDEVADEWETGDWHVAVEKAKSLMGGYLLLHHGQQQPAYFGGEIVGFRRLKHEPRIVFRVRKMTNLEGVLTGASGWGNEQKTDSDFVVPK
jgi:hypothetical protein